jgi:hypothetical protein
LVAAALPVLLALSHHKVEPLLLALLALLAGEVGMVETVRAAAAQMALLRRRQSGVAAVA